jgi:rod shape-determining protein MreB
MIRFPRPPSLYVRISPQRLAIRNVRTGQEIADVPELAITSGAGTPRVVALGSQARVHWSSPSVRIVNPFAHPRSLISDFALAQHLLRGFLRPLLGRFPMRRAPFIVMHPQGTPEGGYTQVEIRALHELARGGGASGTVVWEGRALTDAQVLSRTFPPDGRVLE